MNRLTFLVAAAVVASTASVFAGLQATFVNDPISNPVGGGGAEYDFATVSVYIDPAVTQWIAWNDTPSVEQTSPNRPGEYFFGPLGIGTDDFIRLTITNPLSQSQTVDMDQNDGAAHPFGPQNVIFGNAALTPDAYRGVPAASEFFIDEGGAFDSLFTTAGIYEFDFSYRDAFAGGASHGDTYLLVAPVPEPSSYVVCIAALLVIAIAWRWRKCVHRGPTLDMS